MENSPAPKRQNSKNRRKEFKEHATVGRLKEDAAPCTSRSLDSLACSAGSPGDRGTNAPGRGGSQRARKGHRQGKASSSQRRSSMQCDVAADDQERPHRRGSKRGGGGNGKNNGRKGQRRLRRSASVVADGDKDPSTKTRKPVRRTSSEGPRPRSMVVLRDGREVHRTGSKRDAETNRTDSRSTLTACGDYGGANLNNNSGAGRAAGSGGRDDRPRLLQTTSLTELFAAEVGLAPAPGLTHKESRRRRIVFAVVLVALALLTASVLLVAITLFLSPAVDEVLRKENENLFRLPTSTAATTTVGTVTATATTAFGPDNATLTAAAVAVG
ncbi:uncharacterized protein LOC144093944 isoform X1 [Amblyomma americanum]